MTSDGPRKVAVKVIRPGVRKRFAADLEAMYLVSHLQERFLPHTRRLRPVEVTRTLEQTTKVEMDLRLEAAALSEIADNTKKDPGFRVPKVDWERTGRDVVTMEWIDGIKMSDVAALQASGLDLNLLADTLIQSFLRHTLRDGFFHADMHPGNLFIDESGMIVAVDMGIAGRLGKKERRFLAEILYGFITRDYRRVAEVHFEAGYVPGHHSVENFAQAIRAIGEPIHNRTAEEISMAKLLSLLLEVTGLFDMQTRPELILLQKSMVIVEGVARDLNPSLNVWVAAEPVAREWMESNLSVIGRLREAGRGAETIGDVLIRTPALLQNLARSIDGVAQMANAGVRLDDETIHKIASRSKRSVAADVALWVGAVSLAFIALKLIGGL